MDKRAAAYAEVAQVDVRVAAAYLRYFAPASSERDDDEALAVEALCALQPYAHTLGAGVVEQTLATSSTAAGKGDKAHAFAQALATLQRMLEQQQQQQQRVPSRNGSSSSGGGGFLRRLFARDASRRTTSSNNSNSGTKHAGDATQAGGEAATGDAGARAHSADGARRSRAPPTATATPTTTTGGGKGSSSHHGGKDDGHTHDRVATASRAAAPTRPREDEHKTAVASDKHGNDAHTHTTTTPPPPPPERQTNYELLAKIQREEAELAHKYSFERMGNADDAAAATNAAAMRDGEFSVIFNKFLQGDSKR